MDYKGRIKRLQNLLKERKLDALIVEEPIDILYLTGMEVSLGVVVLTSEKGFFLLDGRYYEIGCKKSPLPVILAKGKAFQELFSHELNGIKTLYFCSDRTPYKRFIQLKELLDVSVEPYENLVESLRLIKDEEEIACLAKAAELGSKGYDFVLSILKEGITELEVARELEIFWLRAGGDTLAFDPIIAFGTNTSMPHYRPKRVPLKKGDTVLIDIGVKLQHYHSDMTRVAFFGADPSEKMAEIYDVVKVAQQKALDICRPGVKMGDLDAAARDYIHSKGYGENFSHGLGHGVGLEIHEAPTLRNQEPYRNQVLQKGMVVTIEPGVYLSDIGGVRIEDTVVVTEDGYRDLTLRLK